MAGLNFSPKQKKVWRESVMTPHRWNVSTGATRSGKTYLDYYKIPRRIVSAPSEGLILLLGNTKGTLERNVLDPMRDIWGGGLVGFVGSDNKVNLFHRQCYALGADKVTQVKRLQGAGLAYCYGDEVATWHPDVFTMLKSRLDKPGSCFDGTCNPDTPTHWFKEFLDSDADIYQMAFQLDDNPFLEPEFVSNLKREYAGTVYYDRFVLGLWTRAEGVIYRMFADNPEPFMLDKAPEDIIAVNIGVDFGGNRSQTAFVAVGITHGYKKVVVLAEECHSAAVDDTDALKRKFVEFCKRVKELYPMAHRAYCDSAESYLIRDLRSATRRAGIAIDVRPAYKGETNDRIRLTVALLGAKRFHLMRDCRELSRAMQLAVWDAQYQKDTRLDDFSYNMDVIDASEYALEPFAQYLRKAG